MIASTLSGPIIAVGLTIWFDYKRKDREGKMTLVRFLMTTKHLPSDPNYSAIINLIPIEFNASPKVIKAWDEYIKLVNYHPTEENIERHNLESGVAQISLVYEVLKAVGYDIPESHLTTRSYASQGFINRDNIYLDSLIATREIANALNEQTAILKAENK